MPNLSGKTCIVTGAAQGIGAAIAAAFASHGATVLVTDINADAGQETADRLGAVFLGLDVTSPRDWATLEGQLPAADVLVNNAGISGFDLGPRPHDPEAVALDEWRRVMAVNLEGTLLGCQTAIRLMRPARKGAIINIASRSGRVGTPGAAAYAASKAAVRNLTKSVALHCAAQGLAIRCNAIDPGAILTPMWQALIGDGPDREAIKAGFLADVPLGRFGMPEEVAAMAVMLASDDAAYICGATLAIDGGLTAR
jgi:3(or 17)beta-hydroxysteroid dehydrogenase